MSFMKKISVSGAALAVSAGMAVATPVVGYDRVTGQDYVDLWNDFQPSTIRIIDNFDGPATPGGNNVPVVTAAQDRTAGNTITTSVGTFAGLGGTGSGNSVTGNNDQIQIRSGDNFGRFNPLTNPGRSGAAEINGVQTNFLDSNDTDGFSWTVLNTFTRAVTGLQAFITDQNDASGRLTFEWFKDGVLGGSEFFDTAENNAQVYHLTVDLRNVSWDALRFTFDMKHHKDGGPVNDGIGIAAATVHVVPLPAPALMMLFGLGALGGLGWSRRNREKASA